MQERVAVSEYACKQEAAQITEHEHDNEIERLQYAAQISQLRKEMAYPAEQCQTRGPPAKVNTLAQSEYLTPRDSKTGVGKLSEPPSSPQLPKVAGGDSQYFARGTLSTKRRLQLQFMNPCLNGLNNRK